MYDLQVLMQPRILTPEDGQEKLRLMSEEIQKIERGGSMPIPTALGAGVNTLRLEGVNQSENPFPVWLHNWLMRLDGMQFDTINYVYFKRFRNRPEADAAKTWVTNLINWVRLNDLEKVPVMNQLVVNILDATSDDLRERRLESF